MAIEIKVPVIGESITEVTLVAWHKEDGEFVEEGDIICDIESDKATVELPAESSGVLKISVEEGTDLPIGAVIGSLEEGEGSAKPKADTTETTPETQNQVTTPTRQLIKFFRHLYRS